MILTNLTRSLHDAVMLRTMRFFSFDWTNFGHTTDGVSLDDDLDDDLCGWDDLDDLDDDLLDDDEQCVLYDRRSWERVVIS